MRFIRPFGSAKAVGAIGIGLFKLLQNEDVRRQLGEASSTVRRWAQRRRDQAQMVGLPSPSRLSLNPRFGLRAMLRRLDSLAAVIPELATTNPTLAAELAQAEADLRRAVAVAGPLPTKQRWKVQREISKRLDKIELALVDAVLPPR